jgi:hypothetical protein
MQRYLAAANGVHLASEGFRFVYFESNYLLLKQGMEHSIFTGLYMHRLTVWLEQSVEHIEPLVCMCGTDCETHGHRLFRILELFISYIVFQD